MKNVKIVADAYQLAKTKEAYLFPELSAWQQDFLKVSDLHELWFAQYGNPKGTPVIVVHGGPGGGCGTNDARLFDPDFYRIILVDQRGAGRSRPHAEIRDNSTKHLIDDMEKLRGHLGIERWLVFGGSWGSALSIAYGQAHSQQCLGFILRGIFLATQEECIKLWYGMGDIYPEEFHEYQSFIAKEEQGDLIKAYYQRLINPDPGIHLSAARAFCKYDYTCSTLLDKSLLNSQLLDNKRMLALARIFAHYSINNFFLSDNQLLNNITCITHLPAIIVHGRYDVICRVSSGFNLHQHWPHSQLVIVQDAGHATHDPGMAKALVAATNAMKNKCS